jgi:zeaxanthin glucosyltransferase
MSRFLFVIEGFLGHFNPCVGVVQHLLRRGHHVDCVTIGRPLNARQVAALGDATVCHVEGAALQADPVAMAKQAADPQLRREFWYDRRIKSVPATLEPLSRLIREKRPDAMVVDPFHKAGIVAAHTERVPYALLNITAKVLAPRSLRGLGDIGYQADAENEFLARYGIPPNEQTLGALSPFLNVLQNVEEFFGGAALIPPNFHLVGAPTFLGTRGDASAADLRMLDLREDMPLAYVSFGSWLFWQPDLIKTVIQATQALGMQVVVANASALAREIGPVGEHVHLVDYAPQLELLKRARVMVTHGGHNSVLEAAAAGVPVLVIPLHGADRVLQAHFAEAAGFGLSVGEDEVTLERCVDTLARLVDLDGAHQAAARALRRAYDGRDGSQRAAALLARLAEEKAPLPYMATREAGGP